MTIRNISLLMSLVLLSLPIFGMDSNSEKTEVTETCAQALESVNHDGVALYYFCEGVFEGMAKNGKRDAKPSDILKFVFSNGNVAGAVKLRFMTADQYFSSIVNPNLKQLDADFLEKYEKLKDLPAAWQWLKGHFKEHYVADSFVALKKKLVAEDRERLELQRKGIFFRHNTIVIDPSRSTES